jgi:PTS system ascorbate-specific IIA component
MIGILVVSHEPLGTALIHCTRHIFGRMPSQLAALDVIPDEDPDAALAAARELLARIAEPQRTVVIAGVNLPLLVKALTHRRGPLDEVAATLLQGVRDTILPIEASVDGDPT